MNKSAVSKGKWRVVAIVVAVAVALTGFSFITAEPADAASKYISKTKALKIALKHSGFKKSQVYDIDIDWDYEQGRYIYEVSFDKGSKEYNYDIHATTGKILKAQKKAKKDKKTKNISRAKALSIALKNAKVTRSQVHDVDIEKDYEWGKWIYEVNFNKGYLEYDYDIAVKGGKILRKNIEYDD
jgi:uncharacterized membrane protein YkoI